MDIATDTSSLTESLGLLDMDNLKVFGETSSNATINGSLRVSERLNQERWKALETIEKSARTFRHDIRKIGLHSSANKDNLLMHNATAHTNNNSTKLNDTEDYVPYCRPQTVNISELITDESINLESNSKVSFEPSEITGRSTHYTERRVPKTSIAAVSSRLSVGDILASSFAPKARDLCGVLGERTSSISGSTVNSRNNVQHTADLSKVIGETSSCGVGIAGGICAAAHSFSSAKFESITSEDFQPAEMMQSKLLLDEISWAAECVAIPTTALSKEAKAKITDVRDFQERSNLNSSSIAPSDANFSVGHFFNMRSCSLSSIVSTTTPDRVHTPVALVDNTVTPGASITSKSSTLRMDDKTYSKTSTLPSDVVELENQYKNGKRESKDSGNGTKADDSNSLSLSTIREALLNDKDSDASSSDFLKVLYREKRSKSPENPTHENIQATSNNERPSQDQKRSKDTEIDAMKKSSNKLLYKHDSDGQLHLVSSIDSISDNKENLDPEMMRGTSQDTLSFTESLVDLGEFKLHRSMNYSRSPLSSLNITVFHSSSDNLREFEDGQTKAVKMSTIGYQQICTPPNNAKSLLNTPRSPEKSPPILNKTRNTGISQSYEHDSTNKQPHKSTNSIGVSQMESEPLCSTRLDNKKNCDNFAVSPDLSKATDRKRCSKGDNDGSERTLTQNVALYNTMNRAESHGSLASPRRFLSPQPPSPVLSDGVNQQKVCDHCSPLSRGGNSANTADRYGNKCMDGRLQYFPTSPSASESSGHGVAPMRTGSLPSLRNGNLGCGGVVRTVSRCSSSSEFSHRDGRAIPLKVTALELSWGSTRLRSSAHKSMRIKNVASKRLTIRIEIHGPGYQLMNMHNNTFTLQSQECLTIVVSFCPTVLGAAIGRLSFHAPLSAANNVTFSAPFLNIPLYGYGGHTSIVAHEVNVGPLGIPFLQIGFLHELAQPLQRTIKIYNKGPLLGFVLATVDSVGLRLPRLCNAFEVEPTAVLIPPSSYASMRIVFRPQREDVRKITRQTKTVLTLANLRLVSGDEATRQRMRRLVQCMSVEDRAKLSPANNLQTLWSEFPSEEEIEELEKFKEQPLLAFDMLSHMRVHEIALTINDDAMDETIKSTASLYFPDNDETVLFRTVCSPSPSICNGLDRVDEITEEEDIGNIVNPSREGSWSVLPDTLNLFVGAEGRLLPSSLCIYNYFKSRQYFEVTSNMGNALQLTPSEGYVEPNGGLLDVEVNLKLENFKTDKIGKELKITVCMENERIVVPVTICE